VTASLAGESLIPGAESLLVDLVLPKKSSVGIRLLRKLGWKEGQGIGPRAKRKLQHKKGGSGEAAAGNMKIYGCALPPGSDGEDVEEESEDDYCQTITFAPKDVCPISFEPKNNVHGIGYRGLDPRSALGHFSVAEPSPISVSGKRGIRGQAFGVGALENEDDDIYGVDSLANYDTVLGDEPKSDGKFGWSAPRHSTTSLDNSKQKAIGQMMTTTDSVLPGFKRSSAPLPPRKHYQPPQLPKDFRPFHRFEPTDATEPCRQSKDQPQKMDSYSRGALLGETPHLNSVFELVSSVDKAKMEAVKMQADIEKSLLNKTSNTSVNSQFTENTMIQQPQAVASSSSSSVSQVPASTMKLTQESAVTDVSTLPQQLPKHGGFSPFARNPEKQKRYELYLEAVKSGVAYVPSDGIHTTEWEREREREEFAQAARLYRPLSAMIATRFTRAKYDDDDKVSETAEEKVTSDREKAVSMKMFGRLTREQFEWHPDKALCKRFNIANPYPNSSVVGLTTVKRDKYSVFNFLSFPTTQEENQAPPAPAEPQHTTNVSAVPVNVKPLAILATVDLRPKLPTSLSASSTVNTSSASVDSSKVLEAAGTSHTSQLSKPSETSPDDRPPMDLFKAIFDNSESSSSSSEEEEEDEEDKSKMDSAITPPEPTIRSVSDVAVAASQPLRDGCSKDDRRRTRELLDDLMSSQHTCTVAADSNLLQLKTEDAAAESRCDSLVQDVESATSLQVDNSSVTSPVILSSSLFGPGLPPTATATAAVDNGQSESEKSLSASKHHRHQHHHHRHHGDRHGHKKKAKHKKDKKKKREKKKKRRSMKTAASSSSSSDADVEDEGHDDDNDASLDRQLMSRLRSLPAAGRLKNMFEST
jgi:G patch domain-containing protein 1